MTKSEAVEALRRYQYRGEPVYEVRFRARAEAHTGGYPAIQLQLRAPSVAEAIKLAKAFVRTGDLREATAQKIRN